MLKRFTLALVALLLCVFPARSFSQSLNANDYQCFLLKYAAGDPYADFDHTGSLTPNDFIRFQLAYVNGSPAADCDAKVPGWTEFPNPSRVFYVTQNGSGTACSIGSPCSFAEALSQAPSNSRWQILIHAGHTITGEWELINRGSGQTGTYAVIGTYNATPVTPRARLVSSARVFDLNSCRGLAFVDLEMRPTGSLSVHDAMNIPGGNSDILIEGCDIRRFTSCINSNGQSGSPPRIDRLKIRRNVLGETGSNNAQGGQGIFLGEQHGCLIEENTFDRGGREGSGEQNIFKRNIYYHDNNADPVDFRGNICARPCSGDQLRAGGDCTNNLMLQNPGFVWGGNGTFSYNVAIDSRDISPEDPRGIGYWISGPGDVLRNIAGYQRTGTSNTTAFNIDSNSGGLYRENFVWDWKPASGNPGWQTAFQWENGGPSVVFERNKVFMVSGGMVIRHESRPLSSAFTYRNNTYFTTTPDSGINGYLPFSRSSGVGLTRAQWFSAAGENGSTMLTQAPADPHFSMGDYLTMLGTPPGPDPIDTFITQAKLQSKQRWDYRFTADAFNDFARSRAGLPSN